MGSLVVIGGSRGLGAALCEGLADPESLNWVVSRTAPEFLAGSSNDYVRWIEADLGKPALAASSVKAQVGDNCVDTLIYSAGIWETAVLDRVKEAEIENIVAINLTSAMLVTRALMDNVRQSSSGTIVFIGSTCGLENEGAAVSVYAATKFGLRGLASALRETLRKDFVRVVCISPGSMATDLTLSDGIELALDKHRSKRMPVGDIVSLVRCVVSLSRASCVKEIIIPATADTDV